MVSTSELTAELFRTIVTVAKVLYNMDRSSAQAKTALAEMRSCKELQYLLDPNAEIQLLKIRFLKRAQIVDEIQTQATDAENLPDTIVVKKLLYKKWFWAPGFSYVEYIPEAETLGRVRPTKPITR